MISVWQRQQQWRRRRTKTRNGLRSDLSGATECDSDSDTSFTCFQLNDTFPVCPRLPAAATASTTSPSSTTSLSPSPSRFSTWSSCGSCNAAYFSLRLKCCFPLAPLCVTQTETAQMELRTGNWNWEIYVCGLGVALVLMGHRFAPLSHFINH